MSRKTALWTVKDAGRDQGKSFYITEMSAAAGEDWALRAILALMQANVDVPEDAIQLGMAALAEIGLCKLSQIPHHILKTLLQELMDCVKFVPDINRAHVQLDLIEENIEEIATRAKLKWEVLRLHVDFSEAVEPLISKVKTIVGAAAKGTGTKTSRRS